MVRCYSGLYTIIELHITNNNVVVAVVLSSCQNIPGIFVAKQPTSHPGPSGPQGRIPEFVAEFPPGATQTVSLMVIIRGDRPRCPVRTGFLCSTDFIAK